MVREFPIANSSSQDLRLGVRSVEHAYLGPDHRGRDYLMLPGDEWCIHAPGRDATFAIQVGKDAIVVLVGGCDIETVDITEHITGERPARAILPIED